MEELLAVAVLAVQKTPAEEGADVVLSMLVVGLIFLAVIVLGELGARLARRRGH
jgi:hypothetical protein